MREQPTVVRFLINVGLKRNVPTKIRIKRSNKDYKKQL